MVFPGAMPQAGMKQRLWRYPNRSPKCPLYGVSIGIYLQSNFRCLDNPPNFVNTKINHLAVWILVVVYFLIGWGWYAIFGEKWLNLHARTMTDIERTHNFSAYLLAFGAAIFVNYALAWLISRSHVIDAIAGLKVALVCWFAFLFAEYA